MWDFFTNVIFPAAIAGGFGAIGWVATNFFAAPLLKFYRTRTLVHESLIFTANVASFSEKEEIQSARTELRRHASAIFALSATAPRQITNFLLKRGYNLELAAKGLIGFSNSVELDDGSKAIHRNQIEVGFHFPRTYSDDEIREIRIANRTRHPKPSHKCN